MMRLRLFIYEGSDVLQRVFTRFPVHVGRHPRNECQIIDTRISRSHLVFDYQDDALIVRDVESENSTVVEEATSLQALRGAELRLPQKTVTVRIGGVRLLARLEETDDPELPEAFAPAARRAAQIISKACREEDGRMARPEGVHSIRPLIDALVEGLVTVRVPLQDEHEAGRGGGGNRSEASAAALGWVHACTMALRLIDRGIAMAQERDRRLVDEVTAAADALLSELSPEMVEGNTSDVSAQWPASVATAVLARYRRIHGRLRERHREATGSLLGETFAALCAANVTCAPRSQWQVRRDARFISTLVDTEEQPPSSE